MALSYHRESNKEREKERESDTRRKNQSKNQSRPTLVYEHDTELLFVRPVSMEASIERLGNRWFLQIFLEALCGIPFVIDSFDLSLPSSFSILNDPNSKCGDLVVSPGQGCSLVFEIGETTGQGEGEEREKEREREKRKNMKKEKKSKKERERETNDLECSVGVFRLSYDVCLDESGVLNHCHTPFMAQTLREKVKGERERELMVERDGGSEKEREKETVKENEREKERERERERMCELEWKIPIVSQTEDFHVTLSFQPCAFIGEFVPLSLSICRIDHHQSSSSSSLSHSPDSSLSLSTFVVELCYDPHTWMVHGKRVVRFELKPGQDATFNCEILPIVCGYLPVPEVTLKRVDSDGSVELIDRDRVLHHLASGQVCVYPQGDFQTGAMRINAPQWE